MFISHISLSHTIPAIYIQPAINRTMDKQMVKHIKQNCFKFVTRYIYIFYSQKQPTQSNNTQIVDAVKEMKKLQKEMDRNIKREKEMTKHLNNFLTRYQHHRQK